MGGYKPIMKKGGSKKSLLTCFKPNDAVDDDDSFKPLKKRKHNPPLPPTTDPFLAYLSDADEDGYVFSSVPKGKSREDCKNPRRKKRKYTWHNLRTAMIKAPLIRKIISRWKTKKEPSWSSIEASGTGTRDPILVTSNSNASSTIDHGPSSTFISPSLMSPTSSSSHTNSVLGSSSHETNSPLLLSNAITDGGVPMKNSGEDRKKRNRGSKIALCILLVISLLVLILWGKFLAIVCTSIWFYLVPQSKRNPCIEEASWGESLV